MKTILVLFLYITSVHASGPCEENYKFSFDEVKKSLCLLSSEKLVVSHECSQKKCEAVEVANSEKLKEIELSTKELTGGKNPATLLCKKLKGKLILGISEFKHQEYFCEFSDKSLISTSSLYARYQK